MNKPKARDKAMRMYRRSNFDYEWKRRQEISKQNGKVIKIKRKGAPQGPLKATVYRIMKEKKNRLQYEVKRDATIEKDKQDFAVYQEFFFLGQECI